MEQAGPIFIIAPLAMLSLVMHAMAKMASTSALVRSEVIGIRTKHTKASDAAWTAGHEAAAPFMRLGAFLGYGSVGLLIVTIIIGGTSAAYTVALVGLFVVVGLLLLGLSAANRAARAVASQE